MIRVSLAIKSHLSDAMIEAQCLQSQRLMEQAQLRLRFIKYLVHMFPDTDVEIDADEVYEQFKLGDK
jgi:division protein CdvB (Snf7/Vps24/ESCRT-III family)